MILVTGASGFVGLNVVEQLLTEGREVVAFSATPLPNLAKKAFAALPGQLHEVTGDVRDDGALHNLFGAHAIRRVLHGAAITLGPKGTIAPPELVLDVNVVATAAILEASRAAGVERFLYTSSSAVYGEAAFGDEALTEATPPRPTGLYGMTKLAAERLVVRARAVHDLNAVRARITAVFGPWEHDTGVRETLSPPLQVTAQALRGEEVVVAKTGGRDWTSSRDVARALVTLLMADDTPSDLYNISLGETWTPEVLCRQISRRMPGFAWRTGYGVDTTLAYNDDLSRHRMSLSAQRLRDDLGFIFMTPDEAAADYATWIVRHAADLAAGVT